MTSNKSATGDNHRERFYRSVAETLALLHAASGRDRVHAMAEVARVLASTMQLPLVWIGRVAPGLDDIDVIAVSGRAAAYTESLRQTPVGGQPRHAGPLRLALRDRQPRFAVIEAPEFAPWRVRAQRFGLVAIIAAATHTKDGGRLTLAAYPEDASWADDHDFTDWAQRLVVELARFWDDQALLERTQRINRYRDAQRRIQRALLEQPYPEAVYRSLANALVDVAGAAAVSVFAVDGQEPLLRRVALAGPHADAMRALPPLPRHAEGPVIYTPTRAFMGGRPVVRMRPSEHSDIAAAWKRDELKDLGALGCWPIFADSRRQAAGVFAVVTEETDAFDHEMWTLLDEIAEATGLALRQHEQRAALAYERER
ncbi:GAF domain-containing protein [Oleiagrimonas sp.]|uniref:GAF domain-containing protein n=1 Tax=Oleiagrimonas sp. TaxID=2010330 RepID=UPI0026185DD8|nr:GAF domain-containing protein [Oleiagrimonas sp.]MDA3912756.1 GAF domain-containing protein [Oleiagrimonas sp.]